MVDSLSQDHCPLIEYHNVTVIRNSRKILDGISLSIQLGEHVAILGPNGAGKTSLLKTITREHYPVFQNSSSYLRILGEEYWDIFELRNKLGIVSDHIFKSHSLDFSCYEGVLSGFFSSTGIQSPTEITPQMHSKTLEIMDFLRISHLKLRSTHEISTGEYRLILIGRSLVHNPLTLLLDEPTSSLDAVSAQKIETLLLRIRSEMNLTMLWVTHEKEQAERIGGRRLILKEGRLEEHHA